MLAGLNQPHWRFGLVWFALFWFSDTTFYISDLMSFGYFFNVFQRDQNLTWPQSAQLEVWFGLVPLIITIFWFSDTKFDIPDLGTFVRISE